MHCCAGNSKSQAFLDGLTSLPHSLDGVALELVLQEAVMVELQFFRMVNLWQWEDILQGFSNITDCANTNNILLGYLAM